jgi:hypothetical protein
MAFMYFFTLRQDVIQHSVDYIYDDLEEVAGFNFAIIEFGLILLAHVNNLMV